MTEASTRRTRPYYAGDPTLAKVMRSPKWIGALLLALLVAGGFAWLGQWQLSFAIAQSNEHAIEAESVRAIDEATEPGAWVTDETAGTVLSATGAFVAGDFSVVEQRLNGDSEGAWVVGHLVTEGSPKGNLAVAIGWAPEADLAHEALTQIESEFAGQRVSIEGRYMPGDAPIAPKADEDPNRLFSMVPAQLVNLWQPFDWRTYAGFLVLHPDGALSAQSLQATGLEPIDSVPPLPVEKINWLNLFYAIEWVVFAGFAIFFWYRLVRDDWERIHELRILAAAEEAEIEAGAAVSGGGAADGATVGAHRADAETKLVE